MQIVMPIKGKPSFTIGKAVIYSPPTFIYLPSNRIKASVPTCSYLIQANYNLFLSALSMRSGELAVRISGVPAFGPDDWVDTSTDKTIPVLIFASREGPFSLCRP